MEKLKKIIDQTDKQLLGEFEKTLKGNNSVKFHSLLVHYRDSSKTDDEIKEELKCTDNSYYVLKSRLFDRMQKFLLDSTTPAHTSNDATNLNLDHYLYEYPIDTGIALLQQLETKYISNDSPSDLIHVYSALKKAHFYSDKYYHYSQLYNNQVAYALGLEKAEEILFNFNRTLASYDFTDSETDTQLMALLVKEIKNVHSLYKSPRIELIHNIITIESVLFAGIEQQDELPVEDLLKACGKILEKYRHDKKINYYAPIITFLNFEYYLSLGQNKKAAAYFDELNNLTGKWLLYCNSCLAYKFLISGLLFRLSTKKDKPEISAEGMLLDTNNLYASVSKQIYKAYADYYNGKLKNSITILNEILNDVSFKDVFFIESEIKLLLTFFYLKQGDFEMADVTLKALTRKLQGMETQKYKNIKQAIKVMNLLIKGVNSKSAGEKYTEALDQFNFYNHKEKKVLTCLEQELAKMV
jgi:hypothetical protein